MRKKALNKLALVVSILLIAMFLISACDSPEPRIPAAHYFSPGASFQTNVTDRDPRRQIRCSVVFEVVDEQAIVELDEVTFKVRNSVLAVLGELTTDEIMEDRNLEAIAQKLVDRINEDIPSSIPLFVRAFFTDFALI